MEDSRQQDILTFLRPDEQPAVSAPVESDPWLTEEPVAAPTSVSPPQPSVTLYVDADNQSAQCAGPLLSLLGQMLASKVAEAVVAGNNHGKENRSAVARFSSVLR